MKTFLISFLLNFVSCSNILYINPIASPSHHMWNKIVSLELVRRGHNVTMLSHDEEVSTPKNFTVITIKGIYKPIEKLFGMEEVANESILGSIIETYEFLLFLTNYDYKSKELDDLINYPKDFKFDLIIFDTTMARHLLPLVERFKNPPVVAVTPFLLPPGAATIFGSPIYTSFMPFYSTPFTDTMNLKERVLNFLYTYIDIFYNFYIYAPKEQELAHAKFPQNVLTIKELSRNTHILLANTDPVLEYPLVLPPNVIPVGGLHAKPSGALPADLQNILDEAKHGAIIFSFGTNLQCHKFDVEVKKAFLKAFSQIPQTIIWKYESDDIEKDLPKNVFLRKWLPQNNALGHSNAVLLINHGGALSTQEAIYHGVPIIGVPHFADQHINVRRVVDKKIALSLNKDELTYENIYEALTTILTNPVYKQNVKDLSAKFRGQAETPLQRAAYWIEYVLRYKNLEHLDVKLRDKSIIQSANLDVLFILGVILFFILSIPVLIVYKIYSKFLVQNSKSVKVKTQ